ncbi:MAG: DcrB-related protein [Candidatus Desantisbacteria bacterium]
MKQMTTFPHNDFVLEIPEKWGDYSVITLVEPPPGDEKHGFQHSLVITRDTLGEKDGLKEYVNTQIGNIKGNFQDCSIESHEEFPVKGIEGYRIIHTWQHPEIDQMFTQMQQYLCHDRQVIVITATALQDTFDQYRQAFEKAMESFQFIVP